MIAAIPLYGKRVSPRPLYAQEMVMVRIDDGKITWRRSESVSNLSEEFFIDQLLDLGVEVLVCGGVSREFIDECADAGIKVVQNVAGQVDGIIPALAEGRLTAGFGLSTCPFPVSAPVPQVIEQASQVDCVHCKHRICQQGRECPFNLPGEFQQEDAAEIELHDVAHDVAWEEDTSLCRVAEVVHFALGMGYKSVGVAFCVEMFREAELLTRVLERYFGVTPVCCRIASSASHDSTGGENRCKSPCNAIAQAEVMNQAGTDLNLLIGLCVGCDILFARHSKAPVTTLFVKDRALANNPAGAVYSPHHLEQILKGIKKEKEKRVS